jgi:hypothetical protein
MILLLNLLTYLLTELSPSWEAANCAPIQEIPSYFKETRRFITVFTTALHWSLSWASSIQSLPSYPISPRSILILSTLLRLCLPSGLFPSGFPTNILYAFPSLPHSCYMPCPSHPPWLDHSNTTEINYNLFISQIHFIAFSIDLKKRQFSSL